MIQLYVLAGSPDGDGGKVQRCVGYRVCFGTRGIVFCKSADVEIRMVLVCIKQEEKRKEVEVGRRDICTRVRAISWFNL